MGGNIGYNTQAEMYFITERSNVEVRGRPLLRSPSSA